METESSYRTRKKKSLIWLKETEKRLSLWILFCKETQIRKIRAPIKIESALPPQKKTQNTPPPKTRNFMDMGFSWTWVFPADRTHFSGVHRIDAPISGPRIADKNFADTRIFLIKSDSKGDYFYPQSDSKVTLGGHWVTFESLYEKRKESLFSLFLVAQCSATPATVAATPFQTQISVRHLPAHGGGRCDTKIFRRCSATPVLLRQEKST